MSPPDPRTLDYRSKSRPQIPPRTPEEHRWAAFRHLFTLALFIEFSLIAFYVGPHLILYHRLAGLTPDDFVQEARDRIPIIVALKEYRREKGDFPSNIADLVPKYLPVIPPGFHRSFGDIYESLAFHNKEVIVYDFTPGAEHWEIRGFFVSGTIPLPPVPPPPATAPATMK